mgnify:CR=1 FL=1
MLSTFRRPDDVEASTTRSTTVVARNDAPRLSLPCNLSSKLAELPYEISPSVVFVMPRVGMVCNEVCDASPVCSESMQARPIMKADSQLR